MIPLKTKDTNVTIGENQPEFFPLPAHVKIHNSGMAEVFTIWHLTKKELELIQKSKRIIISSIAGENFQPILPSVMDEEGNAHEDERLKDLGNRKLMDFNQAENITNEVE